MPKYADLYIFHSDFVIIERYVIAKSSNKQSDKTIPLQST
jgi:hypothetical protein